MGGCVAVILSDHEGFGLVNGSSIGVGKVDSDEIFEGCAWEDWEICSVGVIYVQIMNYSEMWMSGERKGAMTMCLSQFQVEHDRNPVPIHPIVAYSSSCSFTLHSTPRSRRIWNVTPISLDIYGCPHQGPACTVQISLIYTSAPTKDHHNRIGHEFWPRATSVS